MSEISIQLLDEYYRPLRILAGVSSVIRLTFEKMDGTAFMIGITSKERAQNSDNTAGTFIDHLQSPLVLTYDWNVAATAIYISAEISKFPRLEQYRTIKLIYMHDGVEVDKTFTLPNIYLTTVKSLINHINNACGLYFTMSETHDKRISILFHLKGKITFDQAFARMLGSEIYENIGTFSIKVKELEQNYIFVERPNMEEFVPKYFMVYCGIVKPTQVGGSLLQLLKIIQNDSKQANLYYQMHEFEHLDKFSLMHSVVNNITISVKSHDGTDINFKKNCAPTQIKLMFSKN